MELKQQKSNHSKERKNMNTRYTLKLKSSALAVMAALAVSGCAVQPKQLTKVDVQTRVENDMKEMFSKHEPITAPLTLEEAVARALEYNLDYRLRKMESAMALNVADYSKYDMWPKLLAEAGYNTRSNFSGGTSIGIVDGEESLRPSTSQERQYAQASAEFSWNVLDFGVSYYRAKQNADKFLIAEERRRKLVQNIVQDVRQSYWRALAAQELDQKAVDILAKAQTALTKSREAEKQKIISPAVALSYQRALLDATSLLNQRRQDLNYAKHELAALMSIPQEQEFTLAKAEQKPLPPIPTEMNIEALEEMALLQRPELREDDYKKRITADETKAQLLSFFPNLNFAASLQGNSNEYLFNKNWRQASVGLSFNLLKLFSLGSAQKMQKQEMKVLDAHRMALSMAILTQVRVAAERYALATKDFTIAKDSADVDKRLAAYTKDSVSAKLENELEVIRTETRALLGNYQQSNAYANAQIAFGRLYTSLGFDPFEYNFEGQSIAELSEKVKQHFEETESHTLKMKSNLFKEPSIVSIQLQGVQDAALKANMQTELEALLNRNNIEHDANGLPLTFSLQRDTKLSVDKAEWAINLKDSAGQTVDSTAYSTKMPEDSRASTIQASLIAAATSKLTEMKNWLSAVKQAE